jgi:hypothetical protein
MQSQRRQTKPLSITTHNLDFPDLGKLIKINRDHAIVKLANGKLAYAFFPSHAREEIIKLGEKFAVGELVHVAIQRDMPKKVIQIETVDGRSESVEMDTINIQEIQPTYPHKGTIVELTADYAVVRLEDGTTGKSVFSTAEKQLMQERSEASLAIDQSVSVHVRTHQKNGIPHTMDLKEIGSPEPQTAFLISPKGELKIAVAPNPLKDNRTVFSLLKSINTPPAVATPQAVKSPTEASISPPVVVAPVVQLPTVASQMQREGIVLNPKRTAATKEVSVATPLTTKPTVRFMNFMETDEKKIKKSARRKALAIPGLLQFKKEDERPVGYAYALQSSIASTPMTTVKDSNLEVVHAAATVVTRNVVVLSQLTSRQTLFPSIGSRPEKTDASTVASAEMRANKNNEFYQTLKGVIARLQPLAVNKDDKILMKNLFYIVNSGASELEKTSSIISEAASHTIMTINKRNKDAYQRSKMILSTLDGFCKLVASIQPGKNDAAILPFLQRMLMPSPTTKSALPTIDRLRVY